MKRLQLLLILSIIIVLPSCKTQEDIRREKNVENLNEQVAQTQKSTANANSRFMALEEEMAKLTGKIEESTHNRQQEIKDAAIIKERINSLEETNKKQTEFMKALNEKVQEQSKYIEQVITSLSSLNEQKEQARKKVSQKESREESSSAETPTIKGAIAKYKEKNMEASKEMFLTLLDNKKIKKKDKETSFYHLGMIEYKGKNYEEAKVYFSKLFSENPDSTYGASALLNLAKSFLQLKSKEEARQSLDELITRYPKSREAAEGAKLKTKI
ncbi:MAG: tetratricopeptide repeat protein [Bacteriovorax sp.]|nr:tetratricopeptide repeat protein [Bacteriovorax sp.]